MTCSVTRSVVRGKSSSHSQTSPMPSPSTPGRARSVEPVTVNPFERLTQLVLANDRLIEELASSRLRIDAALVYLDDPNCNARFGSIHLERCQVRHRRILAQLRTNRIEAMRLLGAPSEPAGGTAL